MQSTPEMLFTRKIHNHSSSVLARRLLCRFAMIRPTFAILNRAKPDSRFRTPRATFGFSLVEMLVVMALASVLLGLIAPSLSSLVMGRGLAHQSASLMDVIELARTRAMVENQDISVRLSYEPSDILKVEVIRQIEGEPDLALSRPLILEGVRLADAEQAPGAGYPITIPDGGSVEIIFNRRGEIQLSSGSNSGSASLSRALLLCLQQTAAGQALNDNNVITIQMNKLAGSVKLVRDGDSNAPS